MGNFVVILFAMLTTVTFVLAMGPIFKITDWLARGAPWRLILDIFMTAVPTALSLSIPISVIAASLLAFERLSEDGEVTAMKACGVDIWQIISRPLLVGALLSTICFYINNELAPEARLARRLYTRSLGAELPINLLETGRFIDDFPGMTIYVGMKVGNMIGDVIIYDRMGGRAEREIRAGKGRISVSEDRKSLVIELYENVRIDPLRPDSPAAAFGDSYKVTIDVSRFASKPVVKRRRDLKLPELIEALMSMPKEGSRAGPKELGQRMTFAVELNARLVLSLSPFVFVLLGVPFGIKTRHSHSSFGIAISLLIVFGFWVFIILVDSLARHYELRPDLLIWMPLIAAAGLGTIMLGRIR